MSLALVFLVVFLLPPYRTTLPSDLRLLLRVLNVAIWVLFGIDYMVRVLLAPDRIAFVRGHLPDLLTLLVPVLRPLRLLRVAGVLGAAGRRAEATRLLSTTVHVVSAVGLLVVVSGGLVLDAERDAGSANLTTAGDALWWGATTVTTVGYGATATRYCGRPLRGCRLDDRRHRPPRRRHGEHRGLVRRSTSTRETTTEATLADVLAELQEVRHRLDALTRDAGAEVEAQDAGRG